MPNSITKSQGRENPDAGGTFDFILVTEPATAAPSLAGPKSTVPTRWFTLAHSFLKNIPTGEEDWKAQLPTEEDILNLSRKLSLGDIELERRQQMSWEEIFVEGNNCMAEFNDSEKSMFALILFGVCQVAHQTGVSAERTNNAIRGILGHMKPGKQYSERVLSKKRQLILRGTKLLDIIACFIGPRSYSLPYYNLSCHTMFEHCPDDCLKWMARTVPKQQCFSEACNSLYIPLLVFRLLGERITYDKIREYLGACPPELLNGLKRKEGDHINMGDILPRSSPAKGPPMKDARRIGFHRLPLNPKHKSLKNEALSEILIQADPMEKVKGLFLHRLEGSCQQLRQAYLKDAIPGITAWAALSEKKLIEVEPALYPSKPIRLEGYVAIYAAQDTLGELIPLFEGVQDIVLISRPDEAEEHFEWDSKWVLYIQDDTGVMVRKGNIRFIFSLLTTARETVSGPAPEIL